MRPVQDSANDEASAVSDGMADMAVDGEGAPGSPPAQDRLRMTAPEACEYL